MSPPKDYVVKEKPDFDSKCAYLATAIFISFVGGALVTTLIYLFTL